MINPPRSFREQCAAAGLEPRSQSYLDAIDALGAAAEKDELQHLRLKYAEDLVAGVPEPSRVGQVVDARERFARRGAVACRKGR